MKKRFFFMVLVFLVLVSFNALPEGSKESKTEGEVDELRMVLHTANYEKPLKELAARYSEMKPNVTVKFEVVPNYDITWERTQLAARTAPDIFHTHNMVEYGEQNLVIDYTPYLNQPSPYVDADTWQDSFVPGNIERYSSPTGVPYMIPLDMVQQAVYYNKTVFNEYGLEPPETWSEWVDIMEKLQSEGYIPLSINGAGARGSTFVWSERVMTDAFFADKFDDWNVRHRDNYEGRDYNAPDGDPHADILENLDVEEIIVAFRSGELDPAVAPEYRDVFKFIQTLASFGGPGFLGLDSDGQYEQFITQKAVMMFQGSSLVGQLERDLADLPASNSFEYDIFPFPDFEKSDTQYVDTPTRGSGGVGFKLAVAKSTPKREARAVDFLQFILSPENAEYIMKEGDAIGPSSIQKVSGGAYAGFQQVVGTSNWFYYLGLDSEGEDEYRRTLQEFLLGRIDLDTFLTNYSNACKASHKRMIEKNDLDLDLSTVE
jgi:ABC-type glycerol-3-phosphate transport system substrate-binding protein